MKHPTFVTMGIDLGKNSVHVVAMDVRGMETCPGSNHLGRTLMELGHTVRLIPTQYVKPYVTTNKNDYLDAEAIAEAVTRPTMRFWTAHP